MTAAKQFLREVEDFLKASGMTATNFGREAVGDGNFVGDLRDGRAPSLRLVDKVRGYIARQTRKLEREAAGQRQPERVAS